MYLIEKARIQGCEYCKRSHKAERHGDVLYSVSSKAGDVKLVTITGDKAFATASAERARHRSKLAELKRRLGGIERAVEQHSSTPDTARANKETLDQLEQQRLETEDQIEKSEGIIGQYADVPNPTTVIKFIKV